MQRDIDEEMPETWFQSVDYVFQSVSGASAASPRVWRSLLRRGRARLDRAACDRALRELTPLAGLAESGKWRLRDLRRFGGLVTSWSDRTDRAPSLQSSARADLWCLGHRHSLIRATYELRQRWTTRGKEVWIQVQVRNLTSSSISGGRYGGARVIGARRNVGEAYIDGHIVRSGVMYGGGSGDGFHARPRESFMWVFGGVDGRPVPVRADGGLRDIHLSIWGGPKKTPLWHHVGHPPACTVPVYPG